MKSKAGFLALASLDRSRKPAIQVIWYGIRQETVGIGQVSASDADSQPPGLQLPFPRQIQRDLTVTSEITVNQLDQSAGHFELTAVGSVGQPAPARIKGPGRTEHVAEVHLERIVVDIEIALIELQIDETIKAAERRHPEVSIHGNINKVTNKLWSEIIEPQQQGNVLERTARADGFQCTAQACWHQRFFASKADQTNSFSHIQRWQQRRHSDPVVGVSNSQTEISEFKGIGLILEAERWDEHAALKERLTSEPKSRTEPGRQGLGQALMLNLNVHHIKFAPRIH